MTLHCPANFPMEAQLPAQLTRLQSFHLAVASGGTGLQKAEIRSPVQAWPGLLRSLRCSAQLGYVGCGHRWRGEEDVLCLVGAMADLQQLPAAPTLRGLSLAAPDAFLTVQEGSASDVVRHMSGLQCLQLCLWCH